MPAIKAWTLWALRKLWRGFRWAVVFLLILLETPLTCVLGCLGLMVAPVLMWVAYLQRVFPVNVLARGGRFC